ncbi:MAG: MBL fold metallo-hydrolase [Desulfuromonas sp.]|nr:MAG: MBL fold metallo-hydrolase [Desulfuromonas sp.]
MQPCQHTLPTPYPVGPVHCYSVELGGELVLFDTGPPTAEARYLLSAQVDLTHLKHIIITHCHIDHYGLSRWLAEQTGATVYLPFRDGLKIDRHEERLDLVYELLLCNGFTPEFLDLFRVIMSDGSIFPPFPQNYRISEEDLPAHLGIEILSCPGHSQSDHVLLGDGWAVTGDILLEGIFQTPFLDVDLLTGQRFRNYEAYCDSLPKLAGLHGRLILPGHREGVASVGDCLLFYCSKLMERAAYLKQYPLSMNTVAVVETLVGDVNKSAFVSFMKAAEIIFLRDFLAEPERLCNALEECGLLTETVAEGLERIRD